MAQPSTPFPAAHERETAHGTRRAFEGRPLARPGDDIVDQGLTFDLVTVTSRRRMLGFMGAGALTAVLAACSSGTTTAGSSESGSSTSGTSDSTAAGGEVPTETAGPYPGDGSNGPDVLEMTGVERSDIRSNIDGSKTAEGVPITLTMNLIDIAKDNAPFAGAAVYVWHADALGRYSMYSDGVTEDTYLRGVQIADSDGKVEFTSIYPGCYDGRWPHIHFEVFPDAASITDATNNILTSQIALPENTSSEVYASSDYEGSTANLAKITLQTDNVFSDGWDLQTPTVTGSVSSGLAFTINVGIDTTTEQAAAGGGDGSPGGAPPSGGPGGTPPSGPRPTP